MFFSKNQSQMKTLYCLYIFGASVFLSSNLLASFEQKATGVSHIGLSLAGIASLSGDFQSFINPSLIGTDGKSISLFYKNHFGIKDLNQISLHGQFSIQSWPVGLGVSRFGNKLYSETQLTLASSYAIDEDVIVGASSSIYFLEIKNYSNDWTFGFSLAILYTINSSINIAAVINNLNEPEIGSAKEALPVSGTIGIMYSPLRDIELLFDVYKEDLFDFEYRVGARINVINSINILFGFREEINSFSTGLEYITDGYSIKYGVDIHPVLNVSHALGFSYAF